MAKHIDLERLEQSLQAAKKYVDDNVTAAGSPVKQLEEKVTQVETTVNQHKTKITAIDKKLENGVQAPDAALDSIAGLTGTGVVKMTAEDTFALDQIGDADIKSGEAIAYAKDAFAAKDGSVKTTTITSENTLTLVAGDAGEGKANVMIKTASGEADRVVGLREMNKAISDAGAVSHVYMGKFKFYATADTADNAKAKITNPQANDTAVIFAANAVETGKYVENAWTWENATWDDGCWAWIEDIMELDAAGNERPSGRIIMNKKADASEMDVIEDRIAKPDNTSLTYNDTGAIGFKKETKAEQYGNTPVLSGADASSIGFGGGKTIKEKIDSMEYTVATQQDITEMLNRVFPPKQQ